MVIEKHFHPDDSILPDVVELLYALLIEEPVAADWPTHFDPAEAQAVVFTN